MSRVGADTTLLRATVTSGVVDVAGSVVLGVGALVAMALVDVWLLLLTVARGRRSASTVAVAGLPRGAAAVAAGAGGGRRDDGGRRAGAVGGAHHPGQRRHRPRGRRRSAAAPRRAYDAGVRVARLEALVVAGRLDRRPGRVPRRARRRRLPGGQRLDQRRATSSPSSSTCSCWSCRWARRSAPGPSCRPGWARWPASRRSSPWSRRTTTRPERAGAAVPGCRGRRPRRCSSSTTSRSPTPTARRCCAGSPSRCRPAAGWRWSGPSGAGKSTILALIEGFYPLSGGAVRWAGTDVRELPRAALRARLGLRRAGGAGAGRHACGTTCCSPAPDATDPELWAVLADVGLTDVVRRSPRGLDVAGRRRGRAAVRRRAPAAGDRPVAAGPPGAAAARRADRQPRRPQRGAAAGHARRGRRRPGAAGRGAPAVHRARQRPDRGARRAAGSSPAAPTRSWWTPARSTASWPPPSSWSERDDRP